MHDWTQLPYTLAIGPAANAANGLIALASDIVIEPELRAFLPNDCIGLYTNPSPYLKWSLSIPCASKTPAFSQSKI
ncbi:MAG: hypothetical protein AAF702_11510 [Chloroflexota bacterium]